MKLYIPIFLFFTSVLEAHASSLVYPTEGRYGSYTRFCGLDITRHPFNSDIIVNHIHNPAYQNHICTNYGVSFVFQAVPKRNHFRLNRRNGIYCAIQVKSANELVQSCFYNATGELYNSVRYYRY